MPSREAQTSQIDEGGPTSASSRTRAKRSDASEQVSSQSPAPSRRKSSVPSRSKATQDESATEQVQPQVHADPAYPLTRVQKIVKMENEQVQISREAAFILALAAEELTKQLAQAGATEMNAAGRKELALSDLATRVASKDDWSFLREMIPVSIPISSAREKRTQKETVTAVSPPSSTQQLSAQERLKIKVKRPVAPLPSRSSNGATSVIPPHLHVPNPQPTYSLREARAASMQHVPQQQQQPHPQPHPHPHPMPGFPNGVPYYPAPVVSPTGSQSATPDSAYPNGVRWAPGPPPSIAAQSSNTPHAGGRRSSRQQARQSASSSNTESQGDSQSQSQGQPSGYNPAIDPMLHPYMHPPPGFYYPSPPGYAMPPPGMFVPHPGFPSHPSTPVPPAPPAAGKSVTEKPGTAGGATASNTQPAPGKDSHIIDPSLIE